MELFRPLNSILVLQIRLPEDYFFVFTTKAQICSIRIDKHDKRDRNVC